MLGVLETLSSACIEFLALLLAFHLELWWKHCLNKCFENCHPGLPLVAVSGVTEFILHKSVPFSNLECPYKYRGSCRSDPLFRCCSKARSLSLVLRAAHCGESVNRCTYTTLKQSHQHWVFSLFLETENFFQMLGIISDPKPDVDRFWQHQSHLEEVSKPLWKRLGRLWCVLRCQQPCLEFWELVEPKAGRHCHCLVKGETKLALKGHVSPLGVLCLEQPGAQRAGEESTDSPWPCSGACPYCQAAARHVCVTAKGCGPLRRCLGEEPNTAAGDRE